MSDLKYLTLKELIVARNETEKYIGRLEIRISKLNSKINGQWERLRWIDKYIAGKHAEALARTIEKAAEHKPTHGGYCGNNV